MAVPALARRARCGARAARRGWWSGAAARSARRCSNAALGSGRFAPRAGAGRRAGRRRPCAASSRCRVARLRSGGARSADTARDRLRSGAPRSNGRDDAFCRPAAGELPALGAVAARLRRAPAARGGAARTGAAAEALKRGPGVARRRGGRGARLRAAAVRALRAGRAGDARGALAAAPGRLDGLSQLRWMVPQREQPVRAGRVAEFVVRAGAGAPARAPRHARRSARAGVAGRAEPRTAAWCCAGSTTRRWHGRPRRGAAAS